MEQSDYMKVYVKPKRRLEDFENNIHLDRLLVSYMLTLGSELAIKERHQVEVKLKMYPPNEKWRLEEEIFENRDSITALNEIIKKILDRNLIH